MSPMLDRLSALVAARFGLRPPARGRESAIGAVAEARRRALGLESVDAYAGYAALSVEELWTLAAALSNGWTWFFRDREQLVKLAEKLASRPTREPVRVWVAGCSTGEEAYGLAMLCAARGVELRVTATDLDGERLALAARGVYGEVALRAVAPDERERWMVPLGDGAWQMREPLRECVVWRRHNLMDEPPALARFDAVVCRNVLIHATDEGAATMARGLTRALAPGGTLVLGASDLLPMTVRAAAPPAAATSAPPAAAPEPVDATALITMGNLFVEAHAFDRAEAAYRRAEALDPCAAELHLAWGVLHRKRGAFDLAAASLRRAVFLDETLWPAWVLLAGSLTRIGARAESAAALEQARRAQHEHPELRWRSHLDRLLPLEEVRPYIDDFRRAELDRQGG